jgi:hypothetical protein
VGGEGRPACHTEHTDVSSSLETDTFPFLSLSHNPLPSPLTLPFLPSPSSQVQLQPHEVLFRRGDPSDSGIFIVVRGSLGVFLEEGPEGELVRFNTLR